MSLRELAATLRRPEGRKDLFASFCVSGQVGTRVGVDAEGCAAVFFELRATGGRRRSFLMTNVRYEPSVPCRFDDTTTDVSCAVLRCTTTEVSINDLFLRIVESWLPTIPIDGIGVLLDDAVANLVDVFDALGRPGRGEVLGLWGELLLVYAADAPRDVVAAWRCDPFELHDFVSGLSRLEVKTATRHRRHHFSLNQLQPPAGATLTVCSVVAKASTRGLSIEDLRQYLADELKDPALLFRVERTIAATLGDRWKETSSQKYSLDVSSGGVVFFDGACVPCVDPRLPPEVSGVSFVVDCDGLPLLTEPPFPGLGSLSRLGRLPAS